MTNQREVWFESAGTRLFAVELGRGRPIVFLHGGLADHRASLLRVGALASSYRLLAPDLRGAGRSVYGDELSWDLLADDVLALLRHLGIERAIIGGVSAGSGAAVRFALRHPQQTAGLLLMAPVFAGSDVGLTDAQRDAVRVMDEHGRRVPTEGIEVLRPLYERLPSPIRERALEMMRSFDAASVAATTRFLASSALPFAMLHELESIEAPTLLVPGTDPQHPAEVCALYAQHLLRHVIVDPQSEDLPAQLAGFCDSLTW